MNKADIEAVVVGGYESRVNIDGGFMYLIGICESMKEAYGVAYKYLTDVAKEGDKISLPYKLEGETGIGIVGIPREEESTTYNYAHILFNEEAE